MRRLLICLSLSLLLSCSAAGVRKAIVQSNSGMKSDFKRLTRWSVPVAVNTAGIARADEALQEVMKATGGAVTFERVESIPANGIVFVEGGAMNGDGSPGCGHVSGGAPGQVKVNFRWDDTGLLKGTYYIHLGSVRCPDATRGHRRSAVAEHELTHALGIASHFEHFTGNEGVEADNVRAVLFNLYRNPVGATEAELRIFDRSAGK